MERLHSKRRGKPIYKYGARVVKDEQEREREKESLLMIDDAYVFKPDKY
jgi:hypothetical protein